uniref:B30.2/SPRY domain-containing protein n=1 Tax=Acrobeloides nanus TaxID=290746 RepID=A0A914E916_9BILA
MPGWDYLSYAYHGDDGKLFCSKGYGNTYGPTYTTGDTVGCGINSVTREIFFTKNGKNLGVANKTVRTDQDLYPIVGIRSFGGLVRVNFGQQPFVYDVTDDLKKLPIQRQTALELNQWLFELNGYSNDNEDSLLDSDSSISHRFNKSDTSSEAEF